VKSLIELLQVLLGELSRRCCTSTTQDLKTILRRVEHEGFSFLTITLPKFGSDFERCLDQGFVDSNSFSGFQRRGGLPVFLQGFLSLVFDRDSGCLLDEPSITSIRSVRQLTLMFGKIELPCTEDRVKAAMVQYIKTDRDVHQSDLRLKASELYRLEDFVRVSRLLWADYFSAVDSRIYNDGVLPKHGPGATADKLRGNAKYNVRLWTRRLDEVFPHWENLIPSESFLERTDGVTILEPGDEIAVKVISVPKTLKTPRIIAIEPTCMQYMQQGILSVMMEEVARFDNVHHFVSSKSQEPNQWLAREGSISGTLATLDLSEASDRVSNEHVRLLLAPHRAFREAVDATRSRKAHVLGYGDIPLSKFASMGSALCFPMEALVFATIVFMGIERERGQHLSRSDVKSFYGKVRVYGDDIIVPVEYVYSVIRELETFGFLINSNKSFWTGKFRESCGKDYYDGYDVSVARVRNLLPESRRHADLLTATVSTRNQLSKLGYEETVSFLDEWIERLIPFPYVLETSALLGRHVDVLPSQEYRFDDALHYPLVRGVVESAKSPSSNLDDYGALMKFFLKRKDDPFDDKEHLQRAGRPRDVSIRTRWARPW